MSATYSKSAGSVCSNFHVGVLRRQSTRGTPRHRPGYGVNLRGVPHHKLEITCSWTSDLLQRKLHQVLVLLGNLSWANLLLTLHIALHSKLNTSFDSTSSKSA